jgi:putative hydrolase of the HAD superfamily
VSRLRLVLLDVDFTLLAPASGSAFDGPGYAALAAGLGVSLRADGYEAGRLAAIAAVWESPQRGLDHVADDHERFCRVIVEHMGARGEEIAVVAREANRAWADPANFELFDDVRPAVGALTRAGLLVGAVSNTDRDLPAFLAPFALPLAVVVSSRDHGRVKPCPTIFAAALTRVGVSPAEAVMVGDSLLHDVVGARAAGLRPILVDRADVHAGAPVERVRSLLELPALLAAR